MTRSTSAIRFWSSQNCYIALLALLISLYQTSALDDFRAVDLLIGSPSYLQRQRVNGSLESIITSTRLPSRLVSVDYHLSRNLVFWIDADEVTARVHTRDLDARPSSWVRTIVERNRDAWEPVDFGVDHVTDKLYVLDALGRSIEVMGLDGKSLARIGSGMEMPRVIELDSEAALLFVVDKDRILRMNMDGSSVYPIARKDLEYSVSSLTLDFTSKMIYWWDSEVESVESSTYTGDSVKVLRNTRGYKISALAYFEQRLYFLDETSRSVSVLDLASSKVERVLEDVDGTDLKVVHASLLKDKEESEKRNPCALNNGDCRHACLLTAVGDNLNSTCVCAPRFSLAEDAKSCEKTQEMLLYAQKEVIRGRELAVNGKLVLTVASKRSQSSSLDYDYRREFVYFADASTKTIYRNGLQSGKTEAIARYKGAASISVDWAAQNLYYADFAEGTINVVSLRDTGVSKTILDSLSGPSDLAINPKTGQLYFYDDGFIKRVSSDGSKMVTLHAPAAHKLLKLALDLAEQRLYWLRDDYQHLSTDVVIQHSDLNGDDVQTLDVARDSPLVGDCSALAVHGDWLYVVCQSYETLLKMNKKTGRNVVEVVPRDREGFYAIAVVSGLRQKVGESQVIDAHPCTANNGGCEKFCFGVPWSKNRTLDYRSLMKVCDCPKNQLLARDKRTCEDKSWTRMPKKHRCEQDWEFTCQNGRCIPRTQLCDGVNDCLDRSDERNCSHDRTYFDV